ncbi:NAD(P)-dependent oxidoreductase [Halomonas coralii]|uniref:NAD(P)-dependent oxidoreductase n=1 Tax=Modicisalibacter sp. R2A 31.J TaxID=2831898 RepID=UPI001CCA9CF9|nr:NAD(P)-dependent oxidoreductase [Modicisalibacter sp. R2A 31.J]MBZ9557295.1 NAD(P)-dependent oxidoreductase [Modicisalibacter sp. R2A 31.J]
MTIKSVAFIGAGLIGAPMASRVQQAGFELTVCDRNQAVLDAFAADGATVTMSVSDCASSDAVIILLANDAQIKETMLGENGLVQAIPTGQKPIVCMMSTTLPDTLKLLKQALDAVGVRLVDAPISGGIVGAEQGTLTVMMGGDDADIETVMPLMQSMGQRIFHCGSLGAGEVTKVINNMLCVANMYLTAEAVELAQLHGVSFEKLSPILAVSTGTNFLTVDAELGREQYHAWGGADQDYTAIHNIVAKDLHLALKLAEQANTDLGLLKSTSQYVDSAMEDPSVAERWKRIGNDK